MQTYLYLKTISRLILVNFIQFLSNLNLIKKGVLIYALFLSSILFSQGDPYIVSHSLPASGCDKTNAELVRITIGNFAPSAAAFVPIASNTITAHYSIDGGPTVSQLIPVVLASYGGTYIFTFSTPCNLSVCGSHNINTWITYSGTDGNAANNSNVWNIQNDCSIVPGNVTTSTNVCNGLNSGTLNLTGSMYGTITGWEYSTNGGASWNPIVNTTTSYNYSNISTTTSYRVLKNGGLCPLDTSGVAVLTVDPNPVGGVVNSSATLCASSATGSLTLTGNVGTINFWESSTDGVTWTPIANTTNTQNYTALSVDTWYRAQIEGASCADVYAIEAILSIDPNTVAGTLSTDQTICEGATASLSLAGNVGAVLNWESSTDGVTWTPISNTTINLTTPALTQTTRYRVQVQSGVCSPLYSNEVIITVDPLPVGGTVNSSATLCGGIAAGTLNLVGNVGAVNFWETSTDGITWTNVANTTNTQNYSGLLVDTWYRAQIEGGACADVYATEAIITILPATVPGVLAADQTICEGNTVNLSLTGYTGTVLNWETSTDGLTWTSIVHSLDTYTTTALTQTSYFRVKLQNSSCPIDSSNQVIITVDPLPVGGIIDASADVCLSNANGTLTLNGYTGTITDWEYSSDFGATWTSLGNTNTTYNYSGLLDTTYYRAIISSGVCTDVYASVAMINVLDDSFGGVLSQDTIMCEGSTKLLTLTGYVGDNLVWEESTDMTTWSAIANNQDTLSVSPSITSYYHVVVANGICPASNSNDVTITINPAPIVDAGLDVSINEGDSTQLIGTGGLVGIWTPNTAITDPNITNPKVFPLTTTSYIYTVMDAIGCMNSDTVIVTVIPLPGIDIKNVITTNSDGYNDFWIIDGVLNYPNTEVHVFNIYGTEVYKSMDYKNDWNGTYRGEFLPNGSYYYVVMIPGDNTKYRGNLTILGNE